MRKPFVVLRRTVGVQALLRTADSRCRFRFTGERSNHSMSVKSKSSATKKPATRTTKSAKGKDRPFDSAAWSESERLVSQYQVVLHCEDDHWYGRGLEFPKVFADGETADECVAETRKAWSRF